MLKFILKAFLFFLPLLILLAWTDYHARSLPSDFSVKREKLEKNIEQAQIIITGASHAYDGITPSQLGVPTAISIAFPGQDLYYDSRILLKYLPRAKNARLVIITLSYISFENSMEDSETKVRTNFYTEFWDIPRRTSIPQPADYSRIMLFGLQHSRDFLISGKRDQAEQIDDYGGNSGIRKTNSFDVSNGQIAVRRHENGMSESHIAENVKYLEEMLAALKARNIQAVFVTLPCAPSYYKNLDPERYSRMQNEIQKLSDKYQLKYFNFLNDTRFTMPDFFDSDHLSSVGMEKFTLILKNDVVGKYLN